MRDNTQKPVSLTTTVQAGFASSMLTFAIRWIPECIVNRKIVDSRIQKSFFNIGIMWDLAYRVPANTVVFPAQYHFKEYCLSNLDEHHRTCTNKIAIHAFTGWIAGVGEGLVFYPLDTMRTLAQTKPEIFNGNSRRYFWHHFPELYRGLSVVVVRNSVTNLTGWSMKAVTETSLEKTRLPFELQTMLSAFVFGFTRIAMGYPFATIGILIQADTEKRRGVMKIINNRFKEKGLQSFYQGFLLKGGSQIFTSFLQLWLFSWWIHPDRKPFNLSLRFSASQKMQFFSKREKNCGDDSSNDRADSRFNKP